MATETAPPTTALVTTSVDPEVVAMMQIADRLTPLKDALGVGDLSVPELQLFAMVAHRTGLDPFTKQIYAVKRKGRVVHQTGIDGYRSVAERTREYAGSDEPTYEGPCDCGEAPRDHPKVARVTVHRILTSGHVVDQVGVARWHELYPGAGEDGFMWRKMSHNQLAKCAEAQGLRKAFPRVLGNVYIADEMAQAGPGDQPALVEAASKPTAPERIAARRAAIEQEREPEAPVVIDQAPAALASGLSPEAFKAWLEEAGLSLDHVLAVAREVFPEQKGLLSDDQRAALKARLEADRAQSAELAESLL